MVWSTYYCMNTHEKIPSFCERPGLYSHLNNFCLSSWYWSLIRVIFSIFIHAHRLSLKAEQKAKSMIEAGVGCHHFLIKFGYTHINGQKYGHCNMVVEVLIFFLSVFFFRSISRRVLCGDIDYVIQESKYFYCCLLKPI